MKGTEKQIAWAQELIKKMNTELNTLFSVCAGEGAKADLQRQIDAFNEIMNDSYAGDVISLLKGNNNSGMKYYKALRADIKVSAGALETRIKKEVFGK